MSSKPTSKRTRRKPKALLRLPDLDQAKSAVLSSLTSANAQPRYRHAIDEFVDWYCSEPRLSFNRTVVLRYRIHLQGCSLAPGTVNLPPERCDAWPMRPPTVGFLALIWLQASDE